MQRFVRSGLSRGLGVSRVPNSPRVTAVTGKVEQWSLRSFSSSPLPGRDYAYFDNFEVKDGVAIIRLNGPEKMNVLNHGMFEDAKSIFQSHILNKPEVKAVVFISSKPDNFIAGADIDMISATKSKAELKEITMAGHAFFDEIKKTGLPFVAAMHGPTMGGGLEWALYCDYRIATTAKKTVLSLPEVKLGLMPGMAGTYHLPKLIGLPNSLDMILTGKNVRPDKAKKMGLVDLVVDPASLESVAIRQAKGLVDGSVKRTKKKKGMMDYAEMIPQVRDYMFKKAKEGVDKATGGRMPAPYGILEVLKGNYGKDKSTYLDAEASKFADLSETNESKALIGLFKGSTAVKKHNFGKPTNPVKNIAVLGAGLMGAGIAQVSADNGKYRVFLKDKDEAGVSRGINGITKAMEGKLKKRRMTQYEFNACDSRLIPLHDGTASWKKHFSQADMVIEAVFEDLAVKHKVLAEMEEVLPEHAIFASNTSAIPIGAIAKGAKRPERVIGMHYFSPVPMMPLLEIITHEGTAPEVAAAAMEVGSKQGKTPIFVKDVPGFYVNRCLAPLLVELPALVMEGCDLEVLDKAMKDFGMPVGPLTLSDEVGIDISKHVGEFMGKADLGVRMQGGDPSLINDMVENGWLGRKTGKGFYMYPAKPKKGEKKQLNPEMMTMLNGKLKAHGVEYGSSKLSVEDIQMRMMGRFVNETAFCLQDEIVRAPADGDIGAVFGIGFPPHLGGPFRMLDAMGVQNFVDKMNGYADKYGPQFEPAQILKDYAKANKKFHN
jgi:enoyl-CoA hydratase / long-chain 3-hydroxyacyl-CoA dehydrogenase